MLHAMAESKNFFIVDKGINSISLLGAQFVGGKGTFLEYRVFNLGHREFNLEYRAQSTEYNCRAECKQGANKHANKRSRLTSLVYSYLTTS